MVYIPRYREEKNYIIVSKEDSSMDFYDKRAIPLLKNGRYDLIDEFKLFNINNILELKKQGKLEKFFDEEYLSNSNPLKSPISISIEVTRKCNIRCDHCSVKAGNPRENEMTLIEIKNVIDQVKEMEIFSLFISGGEAFLRPDIIEILEYVSSKDIDCFVQTNGICLTESIIRKIPESIYLVISFDGINSCNILHKSNFDFDKYDALFKMLRKHKKNYTVQYVVYRNNLDELQRHMSIVGKIKLIWQRLICFVLVVPILIEIYFLV